MCTVGKTNVGGREVAAIAQTDVIPEELRAIWVPIPATSQLLIFRAQVLASKVGSHPIEGLQGWPGGLDGSR